MRYLPEVFENNRQWAEHVRQHDPGYFERLAEEQRPRILWIGCADSRVPPNVIVGLDPGEIFVHRNIANVVAPGDVNVLSVVQFAVATLQVEHVVVCGHYGCGGVLASLGAPAYGPLGVWVDHVSNVRRRYHDELKELDEASRFRRLCELNTRAQVESLASNSIVLDAWDRDQKLYLHGWIYDLATGLLKDLNENREA
ncbi:MAG: carbonic anhydrase [Gemmatimonadetes bacterium]|jgi:carbonic anhydrase|nr:carbonic anhydrase [Gemmatimonadota bacterium]MBT4613071.1 carbonic anhydrase [Gemmatimonadota bacterium]MBT5058152.1 carbonic anhydrase [Gemmatimonadota bacterium]MBT5141541.1 carbonic anhydrase [Gemmatimonadota bacterium]MBT5590844.1 carbonic anhydrase [Gemmatimonadota bacterium]